MQVAISKHPHTGFNVFDHLVYLFIFKLVLKFLLCLQLQLLLISESLPVFLNHFLRIPLTISPKERMRRKQRILSRRDFLANFFNSLGTWNLPLTVIAPKPHIRLRMPGLPPSLKGGTLVPVNTLAKICMLGELIRNKLGMLLALSLWEKMPPEYLLQLYIYFLYLVIFTFQ